MRDVSIWFKRLIYFSKLEFEKEAYSIDELIKKIKKAKKPPSIFSGVTYEAGIRERKWYSRKRLEIFIRLAVFFNIFEIKGELLYRTSIAAKIADPKSRSYTVKEKAVDILENIFRVSEIDIIATFKEIESPVTSKIIARKLGIILAYEELILFEATIQIYCEVTVEVVWTGKITFGMAYQVDNLRFQLTEEQLELIKNLCRRCRNKNNCIKKIRDAIKEGRIPATLNKEAIEICLEVLQEQRERDAASTESYESEIND